MLKKYISISLIAIFLFDAGGMIFGLQVRQWIHKVAVATIIHSKNIAPQIQKIRISKKKFDEIKIHEREFRLNGGMYDIVWREAEGDDFVLFCYRDISEEKMVAKFLGFLANKTKDNSTANYIYSHSIPTGFIFFTPENGFQAQPVIMIGSFRLYRTFLTIGRHECVDLPPPRIHTI